MWRVLKFLLLVVLCIPAWIAIQVAWQSYAPSPVPSQGVRAVVDAKLGEKAWRVVAMDPQATANRWLLTGLLREPADGGAEMAAAGERVFLAQLHLRCEHHGDPKCWAVDNLTFADADDFGADAGLPAPTVDFAGRVKAVQTALKALGYDPGPLDGALGAKTRAAIAQYLDTKAPTAADGTGAQAAADPQFERALDELEAIGRLATARAYQIDGNYHAALQVYEKVQSLQPESPQSYYNSGIIYRAMGLPDLAIDEYDMALSNKPDWELAFYQRGSAYYQEKQFLDAYSDYAAGLGVRVLGDDYLALRERLAVLGDSARSGAVTFSHWAEEAWQKTARLWHDKVGDDKAGQAADDQVKVDSNA